MSRTQILKMENNSLINSTVVGFSANNGLDDSNCFEFLFNKLLGNEVQCNGYFDVNTQEFDVFSLNKNINDFNSSHFAKKEEEATYTLDDLLDLTAIVPDNENQEYSFDLLSGEPTASYNEFNMDTILASPLSSSSEDSCDLDELLFNCEKSGELQFGQDEKTEVLNTSEIVIDQSLIHNNSESGETLDLEALLNSGINSLDELQCSSDDSNPEVESFENSLVNTSSTVDRDELQNLCLMLMQKSEEMNTLPVKEIVEESPLTYMEEPSSPSSSESGDDLRYCPYKKAKKQRSPEQKQRKKAQNRNAASRYRNKKKDEFKAITEEANELEEKNKELKGKVQGLRSEIDYLKNLMLDVIKARLANGTLPENLLSSLKV